MITKKHKSTVKTCERCGGVEARLVELVIGEAVHRVLESAQMQLPFEIDGNKVWNGVDVLLARHGISSKRDASMTLDIPCG